VRNKQVFHRVARKPLACFSILILGTGLSGATIRPMHPKASSRKHGARLELAKSRKPKVKKIQKVRGQQVIQGERAREIQTALVREGYLKGEPSGAWDQPTKDAMARYQADHGWQTKTLPDSRALIQLGLGPSHENAINAQAVSTKLPTQPVKNSALSEDRQ
jgi:peptidoglycan hydrolase-like protein with peptidoglycan-binding domain